MNTSNDQVNEQEMDNKVKIGQLLLQCTPLTEKQLDEALQLQRDSGELLGEILIKKNYIHTHDIIKALCVQTGIPYLEQIDINEINVELVNDVPINYAKNHNVVPLLETEESVTIVTADPFNFDIQNDFHEIFQKEVLTVVSTPLQIQNAINRIYEKASSILVDTLENEFEENLDLDGPIDILDAGADEAPVIRFVNTIIFRAVKENATDIHIEPYEKETVYRFRINRVMTEILRQPIKTHLAVSSRIKVMAKLNIAEKRLPQDGRIPIKIAGKDIDIRLSTVPIQSGERIVMRILEKGSAILGLEHLGFHGKVLKGLKELSQHKHGILYVTGPTGHGKTTTLFSVLDLINQPDKMIITVEDPVEYEIPGISQIQVNQKIDLSFAAALRSILRQNPDIIMVGETRDQETAEMAIQASLTGHFVLSTLHTNDAASAPTRLIDMGIAPFLISSSLSAVVAQRLIKTLCDDCKEPIEKLTDYQKQLLGVKELPEGVTIYAEKGCPKCNLTGFAGMTCIGELLMITDEVKELIMKQADAAAIKKVAITQGMIPLIMDAQQKVFSGVTSLEEMVNAVTIEEV